MLYIHIQGDSIKDAHHWDIKNGGSKVVQFQDEYFCKRISEIYFFNS